MVHIMSLVPSFLYSLSPPFLEGKFLVSFPFWFGRFFLGRPMSSKKKNKKIFLKKKIGIFYLSNGEEGPR